MVERLKRIAHDAGSLQSDIASMITEHGKNLGQGEIRIRWLSHAAEHVHEVSLSLMEFYRSEFGAPLP
jgi:hypothetical protein